MLEIIKNYHHMQYQVDPTDQTPENGQKPHFWLFGSFKNAFFWFLNDPGSALLLPNRSDHLVWSKYAISSWPDGPNLRKWPTPLLVVPLQPTRRTKNFLKNQRGFSRTCGFRGVVPERLFYHIRCSKVTIVGIDFRQNRTKVEKP